MPVQTIQSWMSRLDEAVPTRVQLCEPVNKFPDLVRYTVQRLKIACPLLGKQKIAEHLCRAGVHLATTTVARILKEPALPAPSPQVARPGGRSSPRAADGRVHPRTVTTSELEDDFKVSLKCEQY